MMRHDGLVLIVDDERDLRELVGFNLRQAGYRTIEASSGAQAIELALAELPAVVVLDLNLPDVSGTDVCRRLRSDPRTRPLGILMLTARGTEADRVVGLELGADDYVVKPFSVRELVLRVDALSRRIQGGSAAPQEVLRRGGIEVDRGTFTARAGGQEIALTALEFRLLAYLMEGEGRVRTRDELLQKVWYSSPELETRTIDTHIKRLRDKLGPSGEAIETVRGVGYRFR